MLLFSSGVVVEDNQTQSELNYYYFLPSLSLSLSLVIHSPHP